MSGGFWNYWFVEPWQGFWFSFFKPYSFERSLDTLDLKQKKNYRKRLIFLGIVLNLLFTILCKLLITDLFGWKFDWIWGLLFTTLLLLFFLIPFKKDSSVYVLSSTVIGVLLVGFAFSCGFGYVERGRLPALQALIGLTSFAFGYGMCIRFAKAEQFVGGTFSSLAFGTTASFSLFLPATGNGWLNYFLYLLVYVGVACRLPTYLLTRASVRTAYRKSLAQPERSLEFLRASAFYSNEFIILPLPDVAKLLRQSAWYNWAETRRELIWIREHRPDKAEMAGNILVSVLCQVICGQKTLLDIAGVKERLAALLPDVAFLKNEKYERIVAALIKISDKAQIYCQTLGVDVNWGKLKEIEIILDSLHNNYEKDVVKTGKILQEVVINWRRITQKEMDKVRLELGI